MGLLDNLGLGDMLKGLLGQADGALPALVNAVLAKTQYHDLNGLVAALQQGGLDAEVKSWLGPGANLPVTEDQLKAVLGNAQVQDFARHLGLPVDQALKMMAQYLPEIVDKASPNGVLKTDVTANGRTAMICSNCVNCSRTWERTNENLRNRRRRVLSDRHRRIGGG